MTSRLKIAVPKESMPGENRVALVPDSVRRLVRQELVVAVQNGAGAGAKISDASYAEAGASLVEAAPVLYEGAAVVLMVRRPTMDQVARLPAGILLIGLLQPTEDDPLIAELTARSITALALERVPRVTRAQAMDVLSSQSTAAGYKGVLLGAAELNKFMPMLTTAAGSIAPARVLVIGAGVAGLQAIATARRLGAVVSAFDIRPAAAEQVRSLGASFVANELVSSAAETRGGYARVQTEDEQAKTLEALARHIKDVDLVISTAQIPGRRAPVLVTEAMVKSMRPGAVIVDLAADSGGNCAVTRAGERVAAGPVTVLGPTNLAATLPLDASQMFSRNVLALLQHLIRDGELQLDSNDGITAPMCITELHTPVRAQRQAHSEGGPQLSPRGTP